MYKNTQAFTLIELLVVVLIIGILAAVAVPQYQKAVLKSHFTQLEIAVKAISNAQELYHLSNNTHATQFQDLDLDLGNIPENHPERINMGKMYCTLAETGFTCYLEYSFLSIKSWYSSKIQRCCVYKNDNFKGEELCQKFKHTTTWTDTCGEGGCHCY